MMLLTRCHEKQQSLVAVVFVSLLLVFCSGFACGLFCDSATSVRRSGLPQPVHGDSLKNQQEKQRSVFLIFETKRVLRH